MQKRINYFTNIAPHYRSKLWLLLAQENDFDFNFYFDPIATNGIKSIDFQDDTWQPLKDKLHYIKNWSPIRKGVIFWQKGVISECLNKDIHTAIFLDHYTIISTWIAIFLLKLKGKKVLFWGHGFYGKENWFEKFIRLFFYKFCNAHILYGNWAKNLLLKYGVQEKKIEVIYNSLDYDMHRVLRYKVINDNYYRSNSFFKNNNLPILIFIGRLTKVKRLELLIEAVKGINSTNAKVNLLIVGDGPEKESLIEMAAHMKNTVYFFGPIYDEKTIGQILANANLCISPGNVGLTAIHSLSFGTPVCTHNNMALQMPEAEAIIEGKTGTLFDLDKMNLSEKIHAWLHNGKDREETRNECYDLIDKYFNPYYQLEVFKKVLSNTTK